jgi:hypothetical protein
MPAFSRILVGVAARFTRDGIFPVYKTNEDDYARTAPIGCFKLSA